MLSQGSGLICPLRSLPVENELAILHVMSGSSPSSDLKCLLSCTLNSTADLHTFEQYLQLCPFPDFSRCFFS